MAEGRPTEQIFASETDAFVSASKLPGSGVGSTYQKLYEKAKRRGGDPGRNILLDGVDTRNDRVRAATRAELRKSIGVLKRMTAPVPAVPGGGAPSPQLEAIAQCESGGDPTAIGGGALSPQLEAIAACESGGDPTAIGGGGLYRGKYQFSYETWASVGGSGDPAAAPEAEQDARAAALLARDGAGHWPACGG